MTTSIPLYVCLQTTVSFTVLRIKTPNDHHHLQNDLDTLYNGLLNDR